MADKIKEAFDKIKVDITSLKQEIALLKAQVTQIYSFLEQIKQFQDSNTFQQKIRHIDTSYFLKQSKIKELSLNSTCSTGNEGVPTDRQTNRQTLNRQPTDELKRTFSLETSQVNQPLVDEQLHKQPLIDEIKLLQRKFQNLTKQEFLIFSTLYILSEKRRVTYKDIALKTKLSESSVRDYILKLTRKGIPIRKEKLNNKQILLEIPHEFRELVPLDLLIRMRPEEY